MRRLLCALLLVALVPAGAASARPIDAVPFEPVIEWRDSRAIGEPTAGRLMRGVMLPDEGFDHFTWDPINRMSPNREWRRWGTDRLVRVVLDVLSAHRLAHPRAPRIGVGDLSRPHGGHFGREFGGLGHVSHQNGLDVDIYYPRRDKREVEAVRPRLVDQRLSQDLVDRFVAAGARYVFTGPSLSLRGPARIVQKLAHHDDHLHVRLPG